MLLNSFKNLRFCYQPKPMGIPHGAPGCVRAAWAAVIQGRFCHAPDPPLFNCPGRSEKQSPYSASREQNRLRCRETGPHQGGGTLGQGRCTVLLKRAVPPG